MFTRFFFTLRDAAIPVTLREYLTLIEALKAGCADYSVNDFSPMPQPRKFRKSGCASSPS